MVVFDRIPLVVAIVLGQNSMPSERNPLREFIEAFTLVDRALNGVPQFQVADVVEQEFCANDPTELAEGQVEPVLPAVGTELPQDR